MLVSQWYVGIILKTLTIVVGNDRHTWAIMARALVVLRKLHNGFKNLCPCFTGSSSKWSYSGWKRTTKISQGKKCKMLCKGRLLAPRQWNLFDVWGIDFWFKDRAAHPHQKLSRELPPTGGEYGNPLPGGRGVESIPRSHRLVFKWIHTLLFYHWYLHSDSLYMLDMN